MLASGLRAVPFLLGVYGAGLVCAGFFTADPSDGFPLGTPAGPRVISWHGLMHLATAGTGFLAFSAAAVTLGIHHLRRGARARGLFAGVTGVVFLAAFAGIASGGSGPTVLAFVAAVILAWSWLTATSLDLHRQQTR